MLDNEPNMTSSEHEILTGDVFIPQTTDTSNGGIYCGLCGAKTYLSADGTHRRCPKCDD